MNRWKWMGFAASLLLATTVLPVGMAHAATDSSGILMGGEGLKSAGESHVYYGAHGGEPIETRVLSKEGKQLLVLSEYVLEDVVFDDGTNGRPASSEWEGSMAQKWCKDLYANGFTAAEKAAIVKTVKEETENTSGSTIHGPCSLTGDYLYFLSANEATNSAYGFSSSPYTDTAREAMDKNVSRSAWRLRSACTDYHSRAGAVNAFGGVSCSNVGRDWGGRPAFRVNLTAVLFASAAMGGKTGAVGALTEVGSNSTDGWKLTLKDGSRNFGISNGEAKTVKAGQTVSLNYTGAKTGSKEYVSAMLVDGNGQAAYYGRMKAVVAGEENGQVEITVPAGLAVGDYTLQVFNEQYNGDKETDYASVPVNIAVKVKENVQPPVENSVISGIPGTVKPGEKVTFTAVGAGMDNVSPVLGDERWKPISWSVNPSGDFTSGYTQSFDTAGMSPGAHTLTITYAKERHDGGAWVDTGERKTQSFMFTLLAAPSPGEEPQAPPAEASPATPTDERATTGDLQGSNPGTGDSARIALILLSAMGAFGAGAVAEKRRS